MSVALVDEMTPGTAYLGCCLNCCAKLGEAHNERCEFVTGEDDPDRHGGILGGRLIQLASQEYAKNAKHTSLSLAYEAGFRRGRQTE